MLSLVPLAPSYPYPFPPPAAAKRANTLLLKHKLVDLLTPTEGEAYWTLLCNLVTAKITREEFELGWNSELSHSPAATSGQLEVLHNALLLSILYNTTKPTLPPASASYQGWTSKRKRGEAALLSEGGADPLGELAKRRRKLKRLAQGMTRAEKKRLKAILGFKDEKAVLPMLPVAGGSASPLKEKTRLGLMPPSASLKTPNSGRFQTLYSCFDGK